VGLGLASLVAESEAAGGRVATVTLRLQRREDSLWAADAVRWATAHGRRVVLAPAVVLGGDLLRALTEGPAAGSLVRLELADPRPGVQRVLLGAGADPCAALLLQAQHLAALGLAVAVRLGPLFPGVQRVGTRSLLQHALAAGVRDVQVIVGQLGPVRWARLRPEITPAELAELSLAYGFGPAGKIPDRVRRTADGRWVLAPTLVRGLLHEAEAEAARLGLRTHTCGCAAMCHLDTARHSRQYLSVAGPDLFARTSGVSRDAG